MNWTSMFLKYNGYTSDACIQFYLTVSLFLTYTKKFISQLFRVEYTFLEIGAFVERT